MKTKIVFTALGGAKDTYVCQAILATCSARKFNPGALIILVVDLQTADYVKLQFPSFHKYISELLVVDVPAEFSNMQRSRYIKTTLRRHIDGDYLYIDTDTIVCSDLSVIDQNDSTIAAVIDRHTPIQSQLYKAKIAQQLQYQGLVLDDLHGKYFNSGVMFVKDCPEAHHFYSLWYKYWDASRKEGRNIDQPPLAKSNVECNYIIRELDGTWNCQLHDNFLRYLTDAKILHYFATANESPYSLYDNTLYRKIAENRDIPEDVRISLDKPKDLFVIPHQIVFQEDIQFIHSNLFLLFKYQKRIFSFIEYIARILVKRRMW